MEQDFRNPEIRTFDGSAARNRSVIHAGKSALSICGVQELA